MTTTLLKCLLLHTVTSLEEFIWKHFSNKTFVIISSSFDNFEPLTPIIHSYHSKVITTSRNAPNLGTFTNYIIVGKEPNDLISSIDVLKYKINTRGRYLVIIEKNCTDDAYKSVFETLWSAYIYNVVLYANLTTFVTWYPYHAHSHCGTVVNMVISQNPYNNKIPKKYDGCPVNVTWDVIDLAIKTPFNRTDPGYIIRLLDTVAGNLNLSIIYLKEAIPYIALAHLSGTYDDLKREMVTKNIDLSIVTSGSSKLFEPELDITHFFLEECIFFALPPRRKIRLGISILLIFSSEIWGLILISIWQDFEKV
ncbi:hypothetical protein Zmor_018049 [Zophobas morio]|uniref:Receptor ligand binding region domain-containing protein n=1 Tax=Zophobas morio TaxID=2755281 RepID=A0AA38I9B7_9CUCU|nr:hypothetical protein Zmor_018049 [Zophobas morio]